MHYTPRQYNFANVLAICEDYVELTEKRNATSRASGIRSSSNPRDQGRLNSKSFHRDQKNYKSFSRQSDSTCSATDVDCDSDNETVISDNESCSAASTFSKKPDKIKPSHNSTDRFERSSDRQGRNPKKESSTRQPVPNPKRDSTPDKVVNRRPRSKTPVRLFKCTLCRVDDHETRLCSVTHPNLMALVSEYRLCRICLLPGHFADKCPLPIYFPDTNFICKISDCIKTPHCVKLCTSSKNEP